MRNRSNILLFLFISCLSSFAQNLEKQERIANSEMREGNALFQKSNFAEAEVAYKKSVATYRNKPKAIFNLGNSMMQQNRYKEAISQYDYLAKSAKSNSLRAHSFHNIGNAYMGLNDYQEAVDAYKNSLRINPKDEETRYNLALAQEFLKQQQEQDKDNKNDQNKDNKDQKKDNKDKEDDKNKENENKKEKEDPKDDKGENQDGDKDKEDKPNEDKQDPKDDKGKEEQKQQQPQPGKLSPQQMKQLLEAMQNEENKTQDKMNAKRVKGKPVKTEKDW